MPSLSPRRRHSVSLPETAPTGPPQRIDQPTTPTPNPSKSTITVTHATNGTLISGSLKEQSMKTLKIHGAENIAIEQADVPEPADDDAE